MEKKETYKDPTQKMGRPRKYTALEEYAIFRQWQEKGDTPIEQIALDNKISMATLRNYIEKYGKGKVR